MIINLTKKLIISILLLTALNANAFQLYDAVLHNKPVGIGQMISSADGKYYYKFNIQYIYFYLLYIKKINGFILQRKINVKKDAIISLNRYNLFEYENDVIMINYIKKIKYK